MSNPLCNGLWSSKLGFLVIFYIRQIKSRLCDAGYIVINHSGDVLRRHWLYAYNSYSSQQTQKSEQATLISAQQNTKS